MHFWTKPLLLGLTLLVPLVLTAGPRQQIAWHELKLLELDGGPADLSPATQARATVFLFARTDCPISNRYAPEIGRLYRMFESQDVAFFLVYLDPDESPDAIRTHLGEYDLDLHPLLDFEHRLVSLTGAQITPEAAVFTPTQGMVYRGRIDDRYVSFGTTRAEPTQRDLLDTLRQVVAGTKLEPRTTQAVGCYISDLQ